MRPFSKLWQSMLQRIDRTADISSAKLESTPNPLREYPYLQYPVLTKSHLRDAKLYSSRNDLIADLEFLRGGVIAEVGVAFGDFSEFMLDTLAPKQFVAFDIFDIHNTPMVWGKPTSAILKGMTHIEFYKNRFSARGRQVITELGRSADTLPRYSDRYFDMIYVDAMHTYEGVKQDADIAKKKIKDGGVLIFNDYIMFDHLLGTPYGVVPVVNELVVGENWRVIGFALQHQLFCDIAIRR